jgi:hypothetical protein
MSNLDEPLNPPSGPRRGGYPRLVAPVLLLSISAVISGCIAPEDETEPLGEAAEAATNVNALNVNALNANALNANALNANALNANALNANALNANALSPAAMSALTAPDDAGALSRQLMKYTVSCALDPTQSFSFSWTDLDGISHPETYPGLLGLAPSWIQAPLNLQGQQWVSACLASRVNWYGVSVVISSRGRNPAIDTEGLGETVKYLPEEGVFWGNLFTATPAVYACNNSLGKGYARYRFRECAAGHVDDDGNIEECGILQIVGSCLTHCQPIDLFGLYHPRCVSDLAGHGLLAPYLSNPTASTSTITVFLH